MTEEAKADYQLLMTIKKLDNFQIDNVPCKIFLPKKLIDPINIHFYITQEHLSLTRHLFEFSIEGILRNTAGEITGKINASKVYSKGINIRNFGSDFQENILIGDPIDFQITNFLNNEYNDENANVNSSIYFWLTPNVLLSPVQIIERSYTGEVKVETIHKFEFLLANFIPVIFTNHHRYLDNKESNDIVTFTELVAECKADLQSQKLEDILNYLDDFLAIVSFITRQRCLCLGWQLVCSKYFTKFYRRNLALPTNIQENSIEETIVDKSKFKGFIETAYENFLVIEPKILIRQAIYSYISANEQATLESSFTRLYSVLETLVLNFRRQNELEFVLSQDDWKVFEKEIKKWIKKYPDLEATPEKRQLIYEKVAELNRVSFSTAFKQFCDSLQLDLKDIWNVTGKTSLTEIRNKLVHGDTFNKSQLYSLSVALQHLNWIVERAILSVFGWPISESRVSKEFLANNMNLYQNWESERQLLAKYTENIILPINDAPQNEV
ncbi:hypothetical protein WJM97_11760 [Okeanomitos corallinicola TIOX110]|uniref:ApeA N-terminal domain-containing protein n=1 Tax=Okeanomitos corallinicola TIOX110 TaxID=3133117 RepID=A0ABZ2UL30_9CYAN